MQTNNKVEKITTKQTRDLNIEEHRKISRGRKFNKTLRGHGTFKAAFLNKPCAPDDLNDYQG